MGNSINNYSKKTLVLVLFFFVLAASLLFFDAVKKDNIIEAAVCSNVVDAMLVIDRSGSMDEFDQNGEKRINVAKSAALSFIDNLNPLVDRVGLEIFANNAELSSGLTDSFGFINGKISSLSVEEGGQTNTEAAIIQARGELNNNGRDYAARVMIILSDGIPNRSYNTGDAVELAITAADTAKANGIRIISIGLDIAEDSDAEVFMKEIASAPGDYYSSSGIYECGLDENGDPFNYLVCIYKQISESICDSTPPAIINVSKNRVGTLYSGDDLIIKSEISDDFGIKEHEIKWSSDNWTTENIEQCTVFSGLTNTCEKNIGTFGEEKVILYKSYVVDTNDNTIEGTEDGNTQKNVEVASVTLEINGDVNGKLYRNQNNTIKISIDDPQGKADDDSFYVSVDSIDLGEEIEFNKKLMSDCSGDGSNWSCSNSEFNSDFVDCSWTDASVDVYVYPYSNDIGYHNYAVTKSVNLENPEENLIVGNCSDGIDNDCNGKTDLESGIEEPDCDNIPPTVAISRKVSGVVKTDIYNNDSVTLSSAAADFPVDLNGLVQHTIFWFKNGAEQTSESCGSAANCGKIIGTFTPGTKIEYYAKATDSSIVPNSSCDPSDCSYYSFIVKDFECDGQLDLTECSGGSGACCNNICDMSQDSNPYDIECSIAGCNGNDWGWVANNETEDCSDGANSDGCYAAGAGCEERNYSCSSGSCSSVAYDKFDDVCVGLILNDYGCNGLECELFSSVNDPSCDSQLENISVIARDKDGDVISSGGDVLDSKTDKVTLTSSANDTYGIAQHKIFWTSDGWTSTNEIDCGNLDECSGQIGPFGVGTTVQYYSRAVDGNGETGETAHYSSFTVVDALCYGVSDMTSCYKDLTWGKCCGGVCDTSFDSSTLYDTECMTEGCKLESWEYVPIEDGESCNTAGENACFPYFSGCEKRDYSCATGLCLYSSASSDTDICSGNIFMDYGCSGADCSFVNDDCSDCTCNCGSYNLDEKIYSSLSFDGVNDYISLSGLGVSTSANSKVSVEFWMKWNGVNSQMPFGWTSYDLYFASGSFGFNTGAGDIWGISSSGLSSGWVHVVAIFNNGDAKLSEIYVNGNKQTLSQRFGSTGSKTVSSSAKISGWNNNTGYKFGGLIDEVRIYNRALADDETLQHYQGVYQDELGLIGHWKFDDEGSSAIDSSGKGNNGTLYGPTWVTSFDDSNNVPSYWRVCSDITKDNDCDLKIDENDEGCDGELTSLGVSAKYGSSLEYTIPDGGNIYRVDMGTLKLTSDAFDNIFGINEHSVHWKIDEVDQTPNNCGSSGVCEIDIGILDVGAVVKYKSYAVDTNNNSKCDPADCGDYYSFTVRDFECFDIGTGSNVSGSCDSGNGECCGGICDTSFDDSNTNGYDDDCKIEGCNGEFWEWISVSDGTSCNAAGSNQCSAFSVNGCETTNYECSSGLCEYDPIDQEADYCFNVDFFKDYECDGVTCSFTDYNCSEACGCSCGSYNLDEKIYSSLSFDGVDDYVIKNPISNFPTTEITAEFWMRSSDTLKEGTPISYAVSSNYNEFMIYNYGSFRPHIKGSSIDTGISANDGNWHHIVVTWRSLDGQVKLYKDGNSQIYTGTLQAGVTLTQGGSLVIGQEQDSVGGGFQLSQAFLGFMDEVRIYSRVLPEGEVLQHYQGVYQNGAGLIGHWKLDDIGNTATDSSVNGNDGTLNGSIWAESYKDTNKNNVPSYWQACTDDKDNDCDTQKDEAEITCDGEFDALGIEAKDKNGNIINDNDEVKDIDTNKISLIATNGDYNSGVKEVTIYWTINGVSDQKTCKASDGSFETNGDCLTEFPDTGQLSAGTTVKYKVQGVDNNNNSSCVPDDCDSEYSFTVILSNQPPVVSDLMKRQDKNYCYGLNNVSFLWTYDDSDADEGVNTQNYYEIQIKKASEFYNPTIPGFFDSGLLVDAGKNLSSHFYTFDPSDLEPGQSFEYDSTYYWRVRVQDVKGAFSEWVLYDDPGDLDGNGYAKSFSTPLHEYPSADFSFLPNCDVEESYCPDFGDEITFTDSSVSYGVDIDKWEWDFNGDEIVEKTIERTEEIVDGDTTYVYLNPTFNQYSVKLIITDSDGFTCYKIKQVELATGEEYPKWNEVAPRN